MTQILEAAPDTPIESAPELHPVVTEGQDLLAEILLAKLPETLNDWRVIIDELDFSLLSIAAARIAATEQIAKLKAEQSIPAVDLSREREILQGAMTSARAIGLDTTATQGLFLALIGKAHEQHRLTRQRSQAS